MIIDTAFNRREPNMMVLVKSAGNDELATVTNGQFPENLETTFTILKDSSGRVITVSEFPFSQSGDWDITLTHYFDKDGRTFAFERQTNFFNSICTDGVAYETTIEFYDSDFQLVNKEYKLVDHENRQLQKDSCSFPYDYEYKVLTDYDKYSEKHKIRTNR